MKSTEFTILYEAIQALHAKFDAMPKAATDEVLLDSVQMMALLKCSRATLQRLRDNGSIPCTKVGKSYYYPKGFFTKELISSIKTNDPSKAFDDQ